MAIAVEMRNITKRFPGITANDSISFQVQKGEIHALLGENGAGKSTLMNILFGLYEADEGDILINENRVSITSPTVANELGIGMVHQHFMLVEKFSVLENIILGSEPRKGINVDYRKAKKDLEELSAKYGLKVELDRRIRDISVGMQQRVEILKTLYRGAEIVIFDEPTAVLTPQEIQELLIIMRNLVNEGKSIILITHKLKEIMSIADTVTIIRRGKAIDSVKVKQTTEHELAAKMVGREVSLSIAKSERQTKELVLQLKNVEANDNRGLRALNKLTLDVYGGEIVGIAGVDGNGQSELIEVITGLRRTLAGEIVLHGQSIANLRAREVAGKGVAHIPEDRQLRGLVLDFTVAENIVLNSYYKAPYNKRGFLDYDEIYAHAERLADKFDIRTPSVQTATRALSGGNQQKAIIAREIVSDPKLLIAAQPTRGLDVGAIEFIHRQLVEQRDMGKAVLLVSFELDEIMNLSDRIAVLFEGEIVGIVDPKNTTEQELGLLMSGRRRKSGERE